MFQDISRLIFALGVVPVIRLERAENAAPLCRALAEGGLPVAEITFRTGAGAEAIRRVKGELPGLAVGAGTVTSVALAELAVKSGASFIVTPGFSPTVVKWCLEREVPVYPGCASASEVEAAMNLGLETVKFFPAEQSGGLPKIKALLGPYPNMKFMPTGGINAANLAQYLACPQIMACGGSFMVPEDKIKAGDWTGIQRLAGQAAAVAQGFELRHAGPCLEDEERQAAAAAFSRLLGL
ncbi:MAG: bifunctional 4-hydroxy-2-oxoglutarate aldolase/2-dehydro-3-deoxy-phosphogluconate aldolase, partial [Deltaproteobacteria bacterium]|nr:bifunctional 4-hydroxy-2-oxoglutarate aldolase/2-dehydro-3-deoxy-phosphogluconate aldolase [Deltaproteobacteria bacterium]